MRTTSRPAGARPPAPAAVAAGVALGLTVLTGCEATTTPAAGAIRAATASATPSPSAVVSVSPATGSRDVEPGSPVTVTVADGRLTTVSVTAGAVRLPGTLAPDAASWTSTGRTLPGTTYTVRATATDAAGLPTSTVAAFATVAPAAALTTSISPLSGSVVGVGMPVVVRLSERVTDRAAVQSALRLTSVPAVEGAWSWMSDEEVHFRPRELWPAGTRVRLDVALAGVKAAPGVYGTKDRTVSFRVGPSMVSTVDLRTLRMTVRRDGKVARVIPVTAGKAGFVTRGGTKVVIEKHKLKVMDARTIGIRPGSPEYYRLDVPWALRVTFSGEFVHAAAWSVGSQGRARVSHGCVGMAPANAIWLYGQTRVGDVVRVVNSPRRLEPGNGWTDWNVPWPQWLAGSAL